MMFVVVSYPSLLNRFRQNRKQTFGKTSCIYHLGCLVDNAKSDDDPINIRLHMAMWSCIPRYKVQ